MAATEDVTDVPRAAVLPVAFPSSGRSLPLPIAARDTPTAVTSCVIRLSWPSTRPGQHLPNHGAGY
eukprot:2436919-Pyramimonas_sp.AAC.1